MKVLNLLLSAGLLLSSTFVIAQEAGRAGTLLKSETISAPPASRSSTMNAPNNNSNGRNNASTTNAPRRGNNNNGIIRPQPDRRFATTGEMFLRIPNYGYYTVVLDDQEISSSTGKYRFFDVYPGRTILSIYDNGYLIYKSPITILANTRVILDFFPNSGLYLLANQPLRSQAYGVNEWDDIWNGYYNAPPPPLAPPIIQPRVMNDAEFDKFATSVKKNNAFDDNKIAAINTQANFNGFTAKQIVRLLKTLSFDKNRVTLAKDLYGSCVDPQNYYEVYDLFPFSSSKQEVMNYVANYRK